jgi:hypothetical protein
MNCLHDTLDVVGRLFPWPWLVANTSSKAIDREADPDRRACHHLVARDTDERQSTTVNFVSFALRHLLLGHAAAALLHGLDPSRVVEEIGEPLGI